MTINAKSVSCRMFYFYFAFELTVNSTEAVQIKRTYFFTLVIRYM